MIKIEETLDHGVIKSVITDKKLFKMTYGQGTKIEEYEVEQNGWRYLLISEEEKTLGLFQIRDLTKITLDSHIYIMPEYWGTEKSLQIAEAGMHWAINNNYKSLFTSVPSNCPHVLKYCNRMGFIPCGCLKNGVIYNNYVTSLFLFEFDLTTIKAE